MYLLKAAARPRSACTCSGSGTILREVIAGAELLEQDFGVPADVLSVTSFTELAREALAVERWNLLHPGWSRRACPTSRRAACARRHGR